MGGNLRCLYILVGPRGIIPAGESILYGLVYSRCARCGGLLYYSNCAETRLISSPPPHFRFPQLCTRPDALALDGNATALSAPFLLLELSWHLNLPTPCKPVKPET